MRKEWQQCERIVGKLFQKMENRDSCGFFRYADQNVFRFSYRSIGHNLRTNSNWLSFRYSSLFFSGSLSFIHTHTHTLSLISNMRIAMNSDSFIRFNVYTN